MTRALLVKELRENAGLAALALLAIVAALAFLWGVPLLPWQDWWPTPLPFVQDDFYSALPWIGGVLAAAVALKQTAWEEMKNTFRFLLHRPVDRQHVVRLKICVGLTLVMAVTALFILAHSLWAASPGKHASPFFWSMTTPAWQIWLVLPLVYLAAFLSGLRPGRWYGSKLLPLAGTGLLAFALAIQPWWWVSLIGSAIVAAVLLAGIRWMVLVRDY